MPNKRKSPAGGRASKKRFSSFNNIDFRRKKQFLHFDKVNALALPVLSSLLSQWLPGGVHQRYEYVVRNPKRADRSKGSFKINTKTGCWCDFATGDKGGDPVSLAAYLFNMSQKEALHYIAEKLGVR